MLRAFSSVACRTAAIRTTASTNRPAVMGKYQKKRKNDFELC